MTEQGVNVVAKLSASRRAVQLYPPTHPKFTEALDGFLAAVRDVTASGPFVLNLHQGRLYVDSAVLPDEGPTTTATAEAFEARKLESLTLHPGFGEVDALGLLEVLSLKPGPELDVEAEIESRNLPNVSVAKLLDEDAEAREERQRMRARDRATYDQLVSVMRHATAEIGSGGSPDLANAGMLVDNILNRLMEDEAAVLGLATIRGTDEADLFHSVNVMIYALTLGCGLGLPDEGLNSLGLAALLHDIGKAVFDRSDPEEARRAEAMHPKVGGDVLGRLPDEYRAPMLVAYEHHMAPDGSGWPERPADYVPHPFSRMVAVADRYDHLTHGAEDSLTPDRAVMQLLAEGDRVIDALFARVFVRSLGVFPIGCVVRLSDHTVGVVCGSTDDPLRPRIRVVFDEDGMIVDDPLEDVVLTEDDRTIVEVVDPENLEMEVSEHL